MSEEIYNICNISQNDFFVKEKLGLIQGYSVNQSYDIGDVRTIKYIERNPEISYGLFIPHYYKVLPAVEYIIGRPLDEGINMYAFVDPEQERVSFIGYTVRPGLTSGNFTYATDARGALIRETNRTGNRPVETLTNVTIVDTGYNASADLTDEQKQELIAIALNDSRVQSYMDDGYDYRIEINGGGYSWKYGAPHDYIVYYPVVDFLRPEANGGWSEFIRAYIDLRYGNVGDFKPPAGLVKYSV